MRTFDVQLPAGTKPNDRVRAVDPVTQQCVELVVPETMHGQVLTVATSAVVAEQPHTSLQVAAAREEVAPEPKCCDAPCRRECQMFCCAYACVVGAFAAFAAVLGPACYCCLALSPAAPTWTFAAERWYKKYVTRCTLFDVAGEAFVLLVIPLMVAISVLDYYLPMRTSCDASRSIPFWRYFFTAFVRAALLEEALKYAAVRRQLFKSYVIDARCLLVYAGWAGTVFGVLENIAYAFIIPLPAVVIRCFLTVLLHASTGIQIGANLAAFRFLPVEPVSVAEEGASSYGTTTEVVATTPPPEGGCLRRVGFQLRTFVVATTAPVLLHGTYDVLLFVHSGECKSWTFVLILVAYLGIVAQFVYIRKRVLYVQAKYPQDDRDVHQLIRDGLIEPPCACCCCGNKDNCCY